MNGIVEKTNCQIRLTFLSILSPRGDSPLSIWSFHCLLHLLIKNTSTLLNNIRNRLNLSSDLKGKYVKFGNNVNSTIIPTNKGKDDDMAITSRCIL